MINIDRNMCSLGNRKRSFLPGCSCYLCYIYFRAMNYSAKRSLATACRLSVRLSVRL